ncbi:MAG: tagaturonate epimerase family protein [Spirochaetes bacterium]|nr:tagaturonate epimerase family protein [Spirochaetota bacterium]
MAYVRFGAFELDPSRSPAVLDTTSWDRGKAWAQVRAIGEGFWRRAAGNPAAGDLQTPQCTVHPGSHASAGGEDIVLATLQDGQDIFLRFGKSDGSRVLGRPLGSLDLGGGLRLFAHPTDMPVLERYLRAINPGKAPRAMGCVPRLGIGDRHTIAVWPAAYRAMDKGGFAANAIQNSVRELNLLDDLKRGVPARQNYLFGFGSIAEGHTGSTFEGLLHAGVMAALKAPTYPRYGADADHIQVKRGPGGLDRARRVVEASRYYTFFTLDVSDILDYGALKTAGDAEARALLSSTLRDPALEKDILRYHRHARTAVGRSHAFGEADIGRFIAKYWNALGAAESLHAHLRKVRGDEPFDMELSIDENPPEISTAECITSPEELLFLAVELERRRLPVTHIAPNFGVEKGTDYRCPDGLEGLERRVRTISRIASERNLMLDCHSGDDLAKATRQAFGRGTGGRLNFKVSPQLQILFAETLFDVQPELFKFWWDDVRRFVEEEAAKGSAFAVKCLKELDGDPAPHPGKALFHYYCFASVGRRDAGRFANRERLYDFTPGFLAEYGARLENWLLEIAEDLYGRA